MGKIFTLHFRWDTMVVEERHCWALGWTAAWGCSALSPTSFTGHWATQAGTERFQRSTKWRTIRWECLPSWISPPRLPRTGNGTTLRLFTGVWVLLLYYTLVCCSCWFEMNNFFVGVKVKQQLGHMGIQRWVILSFCTHVSRRFDTLAKHKHNKHRKVSLA